MREFASAGELQFSENGQDINTAVTAGLHILYSITCNCFRKKIIINGGIKIIRKYIPEFL